MTTPAFQPADPRPLCDANNAVLLVIDLQGKIFEMAFNHQRLKVLTDKLMRLADLFEVPVIVTEQYPKGLGHTDPELMAVYAELKTDKHLLDKTSFGCCGDGPFAARLTQVTRAVRERRGGAADAPVDIVVCGIESHVCVQQTVLELLGQPGHRVVVLQDCIGGRIKEYHQLAVERFRQCGAVLTNFESLAFEWTRDKDDARFKRMSGLIKQASE